MMGQLQIQKKGNLAREGLELVRTQKKKKKRGTAQDMQKRVPVRGSLRQ